MSKPKIKDIAVIAILSDDTDDTPIGEAPRRGEVFAPMTSKERTQMEERLFNQINDLINEANTTHLANCKLPDSDRVDPDYITRLSTHEFFFYTQEPLTLKEFERLQDKIADKCATLSFGIHLVLSSFAVKNADNQVMNVTPHITCGPSPCFHFIIKNNTSTIDVRYKQPTLDGSGDTLPIFDRSTSGILMPEIKVNGVVHLGLFNNLIACTTPGGEQFLTAVEICYDHAAYTVNYNLDAYVTDYPEAGSMPFSHMVLSNTIDLDPLASCGSVMHVDPDFSEIACKEGVNQTEKAITKPQHFGKDPLTLYEVETTPCQTIQEVFAQYSTKLFAKLETLKFGATDQTMARYIEDRKQAFTKATTLEAVQVLSNGLFDTVDLLEWDPANIYIRDTIASYRKKAGRFTVGMMAKADRIERAMAQVPISDRCIDAQSAATQQVMRELASHRHGSKKGMFSAKRSVRLMSGAPSRAKGSKNHGKLFDKRSKQDEVSTQDAEQDETNKQGM